MKGIGALTAVLVAFLWYAGATAQELVHFSSLEDNGPGQASTALDGYLFRPPGDGVTRRLSACMAAAECSAEPRA